MRTTKTVSLSFPPDQLKEIQKAARRENQTLSELFRELFREYQRRQNAPVNYDLLAALRAVQEDARGAGLDKLTMRQIDAEIGAARKPHAKKTKKSA